MHNNNDSFGTIGRVGGYEIVDTIARGGMAVVFRARQPALNRIAALKRLDLRSDDRTVVARFVRESKLGAAFEHPNIVSVFDFFEHDGVPYIAMEYLARGSLRPWVGRLAELQVIGVLEGVLAGLAHAQEHNLAHRDLKPENVLLTRRGGIKIADFGIAKAYTNATQRLTATGMAVGTPTYMAPEQATAGEVGPGTDLYALGVMAYELFSGRPPFADEGNAMALLYRHVHEPAPPLTQVDPRLSAWVARLLEKDPAKRPASALDAWESLEDLAVDLHGPLWRREAAIGGSTRQLDSLPADVPVPVRDTPAPETSAGRTSAPKLLPDTPVGEPVAAVGGQFLIAGPDATIEVSDGGHGAALRHVTRWRRPRTRSRRQRLHPLPLRFPNHVDRVSEIASLGDSVTGAHAVNVYGDRAIGKTHVLVEALQGSKRARGDVVFLDGRGQSAGDLLHTLFEEFYVTRTAVRDPRIARHLRTCSATVAIEDTSLGADELKHLLDSAPRCRFILTSRERVLWDGPAIKVGGMAPEFAPALAAQELGQALADDDHDAAIAIGASLSGHPLRLRQAFSQARESGAPLAALREELAAPPVLQDRLASLSELEARVVRSLAPYGGVSVAGEHLRAVVSEPELDAALVHLEQRHDVGRDNGRYRLLGVLAHALPLSDDLSEETARATAHFTSWLQGQAVDSDAALEDMPAVLALIERSFLEGHSVEAIRLGRAAEGYLSSRQRWAAWGLVLAIVLACAKDLDDGFTEGWAWNQLGVRSLGLGRTTEAQRLLEKALYVRELAGDEQGAAVTRGNLHTLQHVPPPLPRLSHGSPLPAFGTIVLVIAALVGITTILPGSDELQANDEGDAVVATGAVTVTISGSGTGSVVTDPGIACRGGGCTGTLSLDTRLTLTAKADKGSRFAGFSGAGCSGTEPCRIRIGRSQAITARFTKRPHKLALTIAGQGSVKAGNRRCASDCRVTLPSQDRLRLSADAAPGWRFAGWEGDCHGGGACSVNGERARHVTARFLPVIPPDRVAITVTHDGNGNGAVVTGSGEQCNEMCVLSLPRGQIVVLTPKPASGSTFGGWSEPCAGKSACEVTATGDTAIRATFSRHTAASGPKLTLHNQGDGTVSVDGRKGGCASGCEFKAGERVTLRAHHSDKASTVRWGGAECKGDTCVLTIERETRISAVFEARLYAFSLDTKGPGSVDCAPKCSGRFAYGDRIRLEASADDDARFDRWTGCEPADKPKCEVVITGPTAVTAEFITPPGSALLILGTAGAGHGSVTANGRACATGCEFRLGERVTLVADYDPASTSIAWSGADCHGRECELTITGTTTVTATFEVRRFALAVKTDGNGTVDCGKPCGGTFDYGTELTLKATPAKHHPFRGWDGCAPAGETTCTVVVTSDTTVSARFGERPPVDVTLATACDGDGTVTANGRSCENGCTFQQGDIIELAAAFDAGGNAAAVVGLAASDDGERCRLQLEHERIELPPRVEVESTLMVRPRRPLLIGAPIEHRLDG